MHRIASYRTNKNLWKRCTRFLVAPGGGFFIVLLSFYYCRHCFQLPDFPSRFNPLFPRKLRSISTSAGLATPKRPEVRRIYQEYHLRWSRTPLPYDDPSSPQGYWTHAVFMSPLMARRVLSASRRTAAGRIFLQAMNVVRTRRLWWLATGH